MKSWSVDLTYEEHYGVHYEEHCQQAEAVIKDYSTLGSDPIIASVLNLITRLHTFELQAPCINVEQKLC